MLTLLAVLAFPFLRAFGELALNCFASLLARWWCLLYLRCLPFLRCLRSLFRFALPGFASLRFASLRFAYFACFNRIALLALLAMIVRLALLAVLCFAFMCFALL